MFVCDLEARLTNRVQITTDGLKTYLEAMEAGFAGEVDYAVLHKVYGTTPTNESRYGPAQCVGCEKKAVSGRPDVNAVSTSQFLPHNHARLPLRWHRRSLD